VRKGRSTGGLELTSAIRNHRSAVVRRCGVTTMTERERRSWRGASCTTPPKSHTARGFLSPVGHQGSSCRLRRL